MKYIKINNALNRLFVSTAFLISLTVAVFATTSTASAATPPLSPGCYLREQSNYILVTCKTEGQSRTIVSSNNKYRCFLGSDINSLMQADCTTATLVPNNTSDDATGSGDSDISEPKFVDNDCEGTSIQAGASEDSGNHCGILDYLSIFINVLSAAVGIVIVGSLIVAGIRYSTAGSDAQKVSAAKNRILNSVIALVAYLFFFSFLQWLVPGGVF